MIEIYLALEKWLMGWVICGLIATGALKYFIINFEHEFRTIFDPVVDKYKQKGISEKRLILKMYVSFFIFSPIIILAFLTKVIIDLKD